MNKCNLELAEGFIQHCRKTKGEIGEVCLDDSVYKLIEDALNCYKLKEKAKENELKLDIIDETNRDCDYNQLRKFNFNKLRNSNITPVAAKLLYDLYKGRFTINNTTEQIESYNINVIAEKYGAERVFKFRLKPFTEISDLGEALELIQYVALNDLDKALLEVALDMNLKVYLEQGNSMESLRQKKNWKECESLIIDIGLDGLIVDLNKTK